MVDDILYVMPRPKPDAPLKPILLKLAPEVVEALDHRRGSYSRAAYVTLLLTTGVPKVKTVMPASWVADGSKAIAGEWKTPGGKLLAARRVTGFDTQTGEPIYAQPTQKKGDKR